MTFQSSRFPHDTLGFAAVECTLSTSRDGFLSSRSCRGLINSAAFHFSFPWIKCHFRVCTKSCNMLRTLPGKAIGYLRTFVDHKHESESSLLGVPATLLDRVQWLRQSNSNNSQQPILTTEAATVDLSCFYVPKIVQAWGRGRTSHAVSSVILTKFLGLNNYSLDQN